MKWIEKLGLGDVTLSKTTTKLLLKSISQNKNFVWNYVYNLLYVLQFILNHQQIQGEKCQIIPNSRKSNLRAFFKTKTLILLVFLLIFYSYCC